MPGAPDNLFYSYNIGPAHIISFNTEYYYFMGYGIKSLVLQYQWLKKDLEVIISFLIYWYYSGIIYRYIPRKPINPKTDENIRGLLRLDTDLCTVPTRMETIADTKMI